MSEPFFKLNENDTPFNPGRSKVVYLLWYFVSLLIFESGWVPVYSVKIHLLRWFGARIGNRLIIKPNVRIKCPWRLTIGNNCWIGQDTWIDNMSHVDIGDNVCISQGCYICTGSHDYQTPKMDLVLKPISIGNSVWIAARAIVLQGVTLSDNTIVTAGSIVHRSHEGGVILGGNPAKVIRRLTVIEGRMSIMSGVE